VGRRRSALASEGVEEDFGRALATVRGGAEIGRRSRSLDSTPDRLGDLARGQGALEGIRGR
jgi:hypothetical protein